MANRPKKLLIASAVGLALVAAGATYFMSGSDSSQTFEGASLTPSKNTSESLPKFASFTDVKEKKAAFFNYLKPMVEKENARILAVRAVVSSLKSKSSLSEKESAFLAEVAKKYKLDEVTDWTPKAFDSLLTRVDKVPVSLTLAQAANESAWGTSRFAREANNLFGQWCFTAGCGVVPNARDAGKTHEVAKFSSVQGSVNAYIYNLNVSNAYAQLRDIRKSLRAKGETVTGMALANGLEKYSERGHEYVEEIQAMIRVNKLAEFDVVAQ
ncbi:MAG: glucosaminidase domain-containing protein [Pontibacterium sp.]